MFDSFNKMAENPMTKGNAATQSTQNLCKIYLTDKSISRNMEKVFGYRNENLALRFYNLLADGYKGVYIYYPTFLTKLFGIIDGYPT